MSKRKRSNEEGEDDFYDRKCAYERAFLKIQVCQDELRKTEQELKKLNGEVDDYLTQDAIQYLENANRNCDQAMASLKKSKRNWISFDCLPDIPMKQILGYLDKSEQRNLRLVSKNLANTVRRLDKCYQSWKLNMYRLESFAGDQLLLQSDTNISVTLTEGYTEAEDEQKFLIQVFDRVVGVDANITAFDHPPFTTTTLGMNRIETLSIHAFSNFSTIQPTLVKSLLNLEYLKLKDVDISALKDQTFSLTCLKTLVLQNQKTNIMDGLPELLTSCLASLEVLEVRGETKAYEEMIVANFQQVGNIDSAPKRLKRLVIKKVDCSCLQSLIYFASNSLQHLEITETDDNSADDIPKGDFPELEIVALEDCSSELLSILTRSTPKLRKIKLTEIDVSFLNQFDFDVSTVTSLHLSLESSDTESCDVLLKIITQSSASLQEMDLYDLDNVKFNSFVPGFPNLKELLLCRCDPDLETDLVFNSPNLKDLNLDQLKLNSGEKKYERQIGIVHLTISSVEIKHDDFQTLRDHLAMFSSSLKQLTFSMCSIECWQPLNITLTNLRKLIVTNCSKSSGLHNLLMACHSTLEELEIYGAIIMEEKPAKMPALNRLVIMSFMTKKKPDELARMENLSLLLNQCNSLERLVIDLPGDTKDAAHKIEALKRCHLPNLKILQSPIKPNADVIELIERHFSEKVVCLFSECSGFRLYLALLSRFQNWNLD